MPLLRYVKLFLTGLICVSCSPKESNIPWQAEFQKREFSPLYYFQNMEEFENTPLSVEGKIPEWVEGEFVRNGPGLVRNKQSRIYSWFDGLAKLHAFTFQKGTATYSCKFLRCQPYQDFLATGKFDFSGFYQVPSSSWFSLVDYLFGVKNPVVMNANVNVAKINGHFVALTETPLPVEFDRNLNTLRIFDYADDLPKNYSVESAHVLQDPVTKETWNYLINVGLFETAYQIYKIPPQSSERILKGSLSVPSISYMHSFSLAGKYLVLVDYPLRAKTPSNIVDGFIEAFSWYPQEPSMLYVFNKETGEVMSFPTEPFFSYHHVNGFEKEGKIFVDLIAYPNADITYEVNRYGSLKDLNSKLVRLEINPLCKHVKVHPLNLKNLEFPRINDAFVGKEYAYFYAVEIREEGYGIIKYNVNNQPPLRWFQEGAYAGEPVFVPHPQARTEDDGVLLTIVNDVKTKSTSLLILDAKTLKQIARVRAPHFIPFGFHGQFFPDS